MLNSDNTTACCTFRHERRRKAKEDFVSNLISKEPVTSTSFVQKPLRRAKKRKTTIYLWGKKFCTADNLREDKYNTPKSTFRLETVQRPRVTDKYAIDSGSPVTGARQAMGSQGPPEGFLYNQSSEAAPMVILNLSNLRVMQVAGGETFLLFLTFTGEVFSFGVGQQGELGLGEEQCFVRTPEKIKGFDGDSIKQIAVGDQHAVALTSQGSVYSWGNGCFVGQSLGTCVTVPTLICPKEYFNSDVVSLVAARHNQTMAFCNASTSFYVWGSTYFNLYYMTPHKCDNFFPDVRIVQLALGKQFALALSESGEVYSWGDGTYGELGKLKQVPASRQEHQLCRSCAIIPTELILADSFEVPLPKVTAIAAGDRHSLLLTEAGTVYAFGDNLYGQCGAPTSLTRFVTPRLVPVKIGKTKVSALAIAAGSKHSGLITNQYQLMTWGHAAHHKLIHTTTDVNAFNGQFNIDTDQLGVSVRSTFSEVYVKPQLVYELLHEKVVEVFLGDNYSIVATGEKCELQQLTSESEKSNT